MTFSHALSTNNYGPAKFIVDASAANGTHTTIASALTASSSGDTIFIRPGTYTENLTLKAGVNLCAYTGDAFTGNVTIAGTCTFTAAGTVSINGIRLQTNSAFALAVTGSAASNIVLDNCYINCTNNTGISFTSSSASAQIFIFNSLGDIGTTGITLFAHSSAGSLVLNNCGIANTGSSTTASTVSAGLFGSNYCTIGIPITTSGTGALASTNNSYLNATTNTTCFTAGGSGGHVSRFDTFASGTASAISISAAMNLFSSNVDSSNTNSVTGAGTVNYGTIDFTGTSKVINTTTQTNTNSATFTPVLAFGGASVGITYSLQAGKYHRAGNCVFFSISLDLTNKGSSVGVASITGLPFTSSADGVGATPPITILSITAATATYFFCALSPSSSTLLLYFGVATTGGFTQLADTNFQNGTVVRIQACYFV